MVAFRSNNRAELQLYEMMTEAGFEVLKRGWPDLACFRNGELVLVEVKPNGNSRLKGHQQRLMDAFAAKGIKCYRWSPDMGFQPIFLDLVDSPPLPEEDTEEDTYTDVEGLLEKLLG